jgi:uncharacterized protein
MSHRASSFPADAPRRPWYVERWPWLLIAGPALVVVASLASAWIAVRSDDGVVAEDYYKRGLLINRKLAATPQDQHAAAGATLHAGADGVVHAGLEGFSRPPAQLQLILAEPGIAAHEDIIVLSPAADGEWVGALPAQSAGRHIVRLDADGWELPITTIAGPIREIRLGAAAHRP